MSEAVLRLRPELNNMINIIYHITYNITSYDILFGGPINIIYHITYNITSYDILFGGPIE
jgi:hypothetical protein